MQCHLQPLGVLVEHGIHDVDERLVAVEEAMSSREQVALEPTLALVFAEHFHHPPRGREKLVTRLVSSIPLAFGYLEKGLQAVRKRFVGAKDAEIPLLTIQVGDIAQEPSEHLGVANATYAWRRHVDRVVAEIGHPQVAEQDAERARFVVMKAEQERNAAVIRAEGESESAKLISEATKVAGSGLIELRRIEAARDIAELMSRSGNVVYLPNGGNMLLGVNPGR